MAANDILISMRLPADLLDQLDAHASTHNRSRAATIRAAVTGYIDYLDEEGRKRKEYENWQMQNYGTVERWGNEV